LQTFRSRICANSPIISPQNLGRQSRRQAPPARRRTALPSASHAISQIVGGGAPAPRLAGLSYEYLAGAMNSFADGTRTNNGDMPGFMKALSDSDRDAMARYLAGL
jgi:cytochrome c553